MSLSNVEKFHEKLSGDAAQVLALLQGTKGPHDFIRNMVDVARQQGMPFTYDEAVAWLSMPQDPEAAGELSERELESVAGGMGRAFSRALGQVSWSPDMTKMTQLQLQDAMNKQQQAMQMMSSIMKSFHDTAKSIINNLRA